MADVDTCRYLFTVGIIANSGLVGLQTTQKDVGRIPIYARAAKHWAMDPGSVDVRL